MATDTEIGSNKRVRCNPMNDELETFGSESCMPNRSRNLGSGDSTSEGDWRKNMKEDVRLFTKGETSGVGVEMHKMHEIYRVMSFNNRRVSSVMGTSVLAWRSG